MRVLLLPLFISTWAISMAWGADVLEWAHVPIAAFRGDQLTMVLRSAHEPRLMVSQGLEASLRPGEDGQWLLQCTALPGHHLAITSGDHRRELRFVGSLEPLQVRAGNGPQLGNGALRGVDHELLLPVAQRQERGRDRRYQLLRQLSGRPSSAIERLEIFWPHASDRGISPLLSSVVPWSQRLLADGSQPSVHLLVIDVREEWVGWDRYSFMALLTWQIRRHQQSGARVLLLKPPMDRFREPLLAALVASMSEVAVDTGVDLLVYPALNEDTYWFEQPGVLRPWLNESGRLALKAALLADLGHADLGHADLGHADLGQGLSIPTEGWIRVYTGDEGETDRNHSPQQDPP